MNTESLVPTAERTLRLIEVLLDHPKGLSPQELQVHLDMSRSSLFLLLRALKSLGYIDQAENRGRYRLGSRLEAWRNSPAPAARDLLSAFYQEAAHQSNTETLALVMPSQAGPLVIGQVEGSHQIRSVLVPGQANTDLSAVADILSAFPTVDVQKNGYGLSCNNEILDLALPVCPDGFHPQAGLLVSAPAYRWQRETFLEKYLDEMRAMAARLSYLLGAPVYSPFRSQIGQPLQPTRTMTSTEITSFLKGPWAARLACIRPDGTPHVIPVWQEWDEQQFTIIAWKGSQWADFVLQNPNISLTVDEPWPPLRRVVVRGQAVPYAEDMDHVLKNGLLERLTRRYLGQYTITPIGQVEWIFNIQPDHLRGWQGLSGTGA